jgi:hypothetical protein
VVRYPVLERGGDSPKGYHDRFLVGRCVFLGCGPSLPWAATIRSVFWICGHIHLRFIIFSTRGFPRLLGDDSSPRASAVVSVRNPQGLALADGTFFPSGCCAIP